MLKGDALKTTEIIQIFNSIHFFFFFCVKLTPSQTQLMQPKIWHKLTLLHAINTYNRCIFTWNRIGDIVASSFKGNIHSLSLCIGLHKFNWKNRSKLIVKETTLFPPVHISSAIRCRCIHTAFSFHKRKSSIYFTADFWQSTCQWCERVHSTSREMKK